MKQLHGKLIKSAAVLLVMTGSLPVTALADNTGTIASSALSATTGDKHYTVQFKALQENSDDSSMAADYLLDTADVTANNGQYEVTLHINPAKSAAVTQSNLTFYTLASDGSKTVATEASDPLTIHYTVSSLAAVLTSNVTYNFESLGVTGDHNFRILFDTATLTATDTSSSATSANEATQTSTTESLETASSASDEVKKATETTSSSTDNTTTSQSSTVSSTTEEKYTTETSSSQAKSSETSTTATTNQAGTSLADGTYEIPFTALKEDADDVSSAASALDSTATVMVKDGKYQVSIGVVADQAETVSSMNMQFWTFDEAGAKVLATTADNALAIQFAASTLATPVLANVTYTVPGGAYQGDHNFRFNFDLSAAIAVTDTTETSTSSSESSSETSSSESTTESSTTTSASDESTPESSGTTSSSEAASSTATSSAETAVTLADMQENETYTIDYSALQENNAEVSMTNQYLSHPAEVTVKDGLYSITLHVKEAQASMVSQSGLAFWSLNSDGSKVAASSTDGMTVHYVVSDLSSDLLANVTYAIAGVVSGDHNFRLVFDTSTIKTQSGIYVSEEDSTTTAAELTKPVSLSNGTTSAATGTTTAKASSVTNPSTGDAINKVPFALSWVLSGLGLVYACYRRFGKTTK
jgi:heme-binding NEAT domain protein